MGHISEQGRIARAKVEEYFDTLRAERQDFAYWVFPDIRGRSKIPTLCDYLVVQAGVTYLVAVYDCPSPWMLLYTQVNAEKMERVKEFTKCGVRGVVWTWHFKPEKWRAMPMEMCYTRPGVASWDLEKYPFRPTVDEEMLWVLR